jgi:predicted dehydrogenase
MTTAAVIGAGRMGRVHIQALLDLGLDVVAVCDPLDENLKLAAGMLPHGQPQLFADAAPLFDLRPEVVAIATTAPAHDGLCLAAIDAGASVIVCEKPFTTSVTAGEKVTAAARAAGTRVAVNHQMRFMDQYVRVRELLDTGAFGRLASMSVVAGNFGIAMNGSHYFEAFRYLARQPVAIVSAWFDRTELPNPRGAAFRDRSGVILGWNEAGQRFHMDASADQGHGMSVTYAAEFGRINVDELGGAIRFIHRKEEHRAAPSTRYGMPWEEGEIRFPQADNLGPTRAVYAAVLAGNDYPGAEDGLRTVRTLAAAYLSDSRGGASVPVDSLEIDADRVYPWA